MSEIRIIDSKYNTLFTVPDSGKILLTNMNGETSERTVRTIDEYHFYLDSVVFHICQFAEHCEAEGIVAAPEHPQEKVTYGTYEIYQLPDVHSVSYAFVGYENAKDKMQPTDYRLTYRGMMPKKGTLDELFDRHNRDTRPFGQKMRSMSVSDIVVTHFGDKTEVSCCDSFGFAQMPLEWNEKLQHPDALSHRAEEQPGIKEPAEPSVRRRERRER